MQKSRPIFILSLFLINKKNVFTFLLLQFWLCWLVYQHFLPVFSAVRICVRMFIFYILTIPQLKLSYLILIICYILSISKRVFPTLSFVIFSASLIHLELHYSVNTFGVETLNLFGAVFISVPVFIAPQ